MAVYNALVVVHLGLWNPRVSQLGKVLASCSSCVSVKALTCLVWNHLEFAVVCVRHKLVLLVWTLRKEFLLGSWVLSLGLGLVDIGVNTAVV